MFELACAEKTRGCVADDLEIRQWQVVFTQNTDVYTYYLVRISETLAQRRNEIALLLLGR